jgi:hypothetical protein
MEGLRSLQGLPDGQSRDGDYVVYREGTEMGRIENEREIWRKKSQRCRTVAEIQLKSGHKDSANKTTSCFWTLTLLGPQTYSLVLSIALAITSLPGMVQDKHHLVKFLLSLQEEQRFQAGGSLTRQGWDIFTLYQKDNSEGANKTKSQVLCRI